MIENEASKETVYDVVVARHEDGSTRNYSAYFEDIGFEIVASLRVGGYQGDWLFLLHNPDTGHFGFNTIGYGSCSGCDALLAHSSACWTYNDEGNRVLRDEGLEDLTDYLWRCVQRFKWAETSEKLVGFLEDREWTSQFVSYGMTEDETARSGYQEIDTVISELEAYVSST